MSHAHVRETGIDARTEGCAVRSASVSAEIATRFKLLGPALAERVAAGAEGRPPAASGSERVQ